MDDNNTSIPPDTMGAAGPSHLMTMLNTQVRIQNKTGGNISTVSLDAFWTGGTGLSGDPFDPVVIYDSANNRWIATCCADSQSTGSKVFFAISATSDPSGAWTYYSFTADPTGTDWADFPGMGVNTNWIAITMNMFSVSANAFAGARMWVIDKSTALAGGALTVTVFPTGFDDGGGYAGFTLKPCLTFGGESNLYIVDQRGYSSGGTYLLRMSEITGTPASPSWSVTPGSVFGDQYGFFFVDNNFTYAQIDAGQLGVTNLVQTNDPRLQNPVFRNGNIWCTHSGGLPEGGTADRTAIFWYQLDPSLMTASGAPIVQSGVLDGGAGVHHFFPSIAVNASNDVCIGFSRSDSTRYVEAASTSRYGNDPAGTMDPITVIKAGEDSYIKDFGAGRIRWGDYSATVVDPSDDLTFWTLQEYAETDVGSSANDDRWGTWWGRSDGISPTCSIMRNDTNPTAASTVHFSVDFSGDVTGFAQSDVDLTGTAPGKSITGFSGSGSNYTVTVGGISGSGTVAIDVDAGQCTDAAGNPNAAGASVGYDIDQTAPAIVSITSTNENGTYGEGQSIDITLNFSENVTLVGGDLAITLETGGVDREVSISAITATNAASGVYTVQAGDSSADLSVKTNALGGATLRDAVGNDADLGIPVGQNLDDNRDIAVDTSHTVAAGKTGNGAITPEGDVTVEHGGTTNFLIQASNAYHIASIMTNGSHIAGSPYSGNAFTSTNFVWSNIVADGTITANFAINQHTLTVVSAHGGADPGTQTADWGTALSQFVTNSPLSGGAGTQYVCTGWSMIGNEPVSGTGTNVAMILTNSAVLTWNWQTQYWLNATSEPNGGIDASNGWHSAGTTNTITATPEPDHFFAGWSGDVESTDNPLILVMTQAYSVTANFGDDRDGDGIPDWWETQYYGGPTNANPSAICSNGVNTVLEAYIAGLDPTDPAPDASVVFSDPWNTLWWDSASGRVYAIYWTTNLSDGFLPLETNIHWPVEGFTDTAHNAETKGFYKIDVKKE